MLDTQYRMHPAITEFPSREFYAGLLHDAPGMAEKMTAPWHEHAGLGPLAFYDVRGAHGRAASPCCSRTLQGNELIQTHAGTAHPRYLLCHVPRIDGHASRLCQTSIRLFWLP